MNGNKVSQTKKSIPVVVWLIIGLIMVYFQIVIGGITRLTGSGLSITTWDIVTGILPPIGELQWLEEFEKYKLTPQYKKINVGMEMGSIFTPETFKFIYFWEYLHRLWARTMGFVFLIPFLFFYYKKLIPSSLLKHFAAIIFLAALAASFGWIMVASGLNSRPWVNAYKLSIHLCIGISVFMALWWAFIRYVHRFKKELNFSRSGYLMWLLILLSIQIFLGGVMSGTKAALFINTWPDYNGSALPEAILERAAWSFYNFSNYEETGFLVSLIQMFHRSVAYIIFFYAFYVLIKRSMWSLKTRIDTTYVIFFCILLLQILIGIITLINSTGTIPVYWGVLHQALAVITMAIFILHLFYGSYLESIRPNMN